MITSEQVAEGLGGVEDPELTAMSQEERTRVIGDVRGRAARVGSAESRTRILAVGSGKGGVGKSTVAANLDRTAEGVMGWALVTGASGEIGSVIAERLADDGYDLVLHTFRRQQAADSLAERIRQRGRQALVIRANFAAPGATGRFADQVAEATGGVTALVAAAASGVMRPAAELTERHLDWTFAVNVRALSLLATRLRPHSTVALTSPGSVSVVPGYAGIGPSKAALESLVRYLAVELAPVCRVNALSAGLVVTRAARLLPGWEELAVTTPARTPLGRLVTAADIANAAAWLICDQAAMVTGTTLMLDGGRHLLF